MSRGTPWTDAGRDGPEAKLARYAERFNLLDEDVDYLLTLMQEARGLGSLAGAAAEREACALAVRSLRSNAGAQWLSALGEAEDAIRARG